MSYTQVHTISVQVGLDSIVMEKDSGMFKVTAKSAVSKADALSRLEAFVAKLEAAIEKERNS